MRVRVAAEVSPFFIYLFLSGLFLVYFVSLYMRDMHAWFGRFFRGCVCWEGAAPRRENTALFMC